MLDRHTLASAPIVPASCTGESAFTFLTERSGGRHREYVYLVPFVEDEHAVFLKTIIPSRKATKEYLGEEFHDEDGR